jgi:hypothetical protein
LQIDVPANPRGGHVEPRTNLNCGQILSGIGNADSVVDYTDEVLMPAKNRGCQAFAASRTEASFKPQFGALSETRAPLARRLH